jgi:hypothetical protein
MLCAPMQIEQARRMPENFRESTYVIEHREGSCGISVRNDPANHRERLREEPRVRNPRENRRKEPP